MTESLNFQVNNTLDEIINSNNVISINTSLHKVCHCFRTK